MSKVVGRMGQNQRFFMKILDDKQYANALMELIAGRGVQEIE